MNISAKEIGVSEESAGDLKKECSTNRQLYNNGTVDFAQELELRILESYDSGDIEKAESLQKSLSSVQAHKTDLLKVRVEAIKAKAELTRAENDWLTKVTKFFKRRFPKLFGAIE